LENPSIIKHGICWTFKSFSYVKNRLKIVKFICRRGTKLGCLSKLEHKKKNGKKKEEKLK